MIPAIDAGDLRVDTARRMHSPPAEQESRADEVLMRAYGDGDARAFEALYARHKGATYRYFLRHAGGQAATADELHQDLWLKVIGARERYAAQAKFSAWLYTLARRRMIDHWRTRDGVSLESLEDAEILAQAEASFAELQGASDDPLGASIDFQARQRLVAALTEVPTLQRDAFLLHVEGGLSLEEIAGLTAASGETVKSRLRYAYRRLRAALEDLQ